MIGEPTRRLDEGALRDLIPRVLAGLVRRGEDFDAAEDALQEALLEALRVWPEHPPGDPRAWLATGATPRLVAAPPREGPRPRPGGGGGVSGPAAARPRAGAARRWWTSSRRPLRPRSGRATTRSSCSSAAAIRT